MARCPDIWLGPNNDPTSDEMKARIARTTAAHLKGDRMTARCKFTVTSVKHFGYGGREIELGTQYDPTLKEDVSFSKATPSGSMKITIDNPNVFGVFEPGKTVYIDVTPCE